MVRHLILLFAKVQLSAAFFSQTSLKTSIIISFDTAAQLSKGEWEITFLQSEN